MFEIIVICICLFLNALLAGSEAAFIATDKVLLKGIAENGSREAKQLLSMRENPERLLATIQVGITFVAGFAAAMGGAGAQESISPWLSDTLNLGKNIAEFIGMLIVVIPLTFVSVVLSELVPKTLALKRPISISLKLAHIFVFLNKLLFPIVFVFEWLTKKVVDFVNRKSLASDETGVEQEDVVSEKNREYIINMISIDKKTVKQSLISWSQVSHIQTHEPIDAVEKKFIKSGHTRLPVLKENNVVGILNSKEFFAYQKTGKEDWVSLARKPVTLDENTRILKAMRLLQKASSHMAIVKSDGKTTGIITIEDIIEEIVGDIYDEDDYGSIKNILSNTRYRF